MDTFTIGIGKEKKVEKIKGIEYLHHGDMKELAKQIGVHEQTVSKVVRGEYDNVRVQTAVIALIEIRKEQLNESVKNVARITIN